MKSIMISYKLDYLYHQVSITGTLSLTMRLTIISDLICGQSQVLTISDSYKTVGNERKGVRWILYKSSTPKIDVQLNV